jgi:hypothetical protein
MYHLAVSIWTFDVSSYSSFTWGNRFASWVHMLRPSRDQTRLHVVSSMPSNEKWISFYTDKEDLMQCRLTTLLLSTTIMCSCTFAVFYKVMSVKVMFWYIKLTIQRQKRGNYRGIGLLNACYELAFKWKVESTGRKFPFVMPEWIPKKADLASIHCLVCSKKKRI